MTVKQIFSNIWPQGVTPIRFVDWIKSLPKEQQDEYWIGRKNGDQLRQIAIDQGSLVFSKGGEYIWRDQGAFKKNKENDPIWEKYWMRWQKETGAQFIMTTQTYKKLKEFSVVYTDRSLNHMSDEFIDVMKDISDTLKEAYNADTAVIVPGSGTFGMEAVARQFANKKKCLILRNGWFSYRWSQIFDAGNISDDVSVVMAQRRQPGDQEPFEPADINRVVEMIYDLQPNMVFAPHVETSAGMILSDDYLRAVGAATQAVGGLFVLDCIASGATWVDIQGCNVDVLVSAPQKAWTSSPCAALVVMNQRARLHMESTQSSSFAMDLKKWTQVMETFEKGSHLYSSTMPTDSLRILRDTMIETRKAGFANLKQRQALMGQRVRELFESHGFKSVAASGYQSPGVIVSYTTDADLANTKRFAELGIQSAAGVPLVCNEGDGFRTFRIGLLGLNKLLDIDGVVATLSDALDQLTGKK